MQSEPDDSAWDRLEALFQRAAELDGEERDTFLDRACGPDATLRKELEGLLTASAEAGRRTLWRRPAIEHEARQSAPIDHSGGQVPRYRLRGRIGIGGMGIVYRAVRADDVFEKEVAIKIVQH